MTLTIAKVESGIMTGQERLYDAALFTIAQRHMDGLLTDTLIPTEHDRLAVLRIMAVEVGHEIDRLERLLG